MTDRLTGHDAIDHVGSLREQGIDATLSMYATDIEPGGREGLAPDEAREIVREDPALIYYDAEVTRPDETRLIVGGREIPPYEGAVAYVRNTAGECGIRYPDGYTDWLGTANRAFGDEEVAVHPSEEA